MRTGMMAYHAPSIGMITFSLLSTRTLTTWIERELSTLHPKRRQEHAVALGRAIIAHWTFSVQEKGLLANTTLLERYRARAELLMQDNADNYYNGVWQPRGHTWER